MLNMFMNDLFQDSSIVYIYFEYLNLGRSSYLGKANALNKGKGRRERKSAQGNSA